MLDRQIQIYGLDTGDFYTKKEQLLHNKNHKVRAEKRYLVNAIEKLEKKKQKLDDSKEIKALNLKIELYRSYIEFKNPIINESKKELKRKLENKINANIKSNGKDHIRKLNRANLNEKKIISVFDSFFTRTIGARQDKFSEEFMVVQIYYFDILKDLIYFGFEYKGEKYIYLTSSAGQIRTKKAVFVKETTYKKYEKTLLCGLTLKMINQKGGNNPNKHLAYTALINSATDVWKEFDIDKAIVIDDFETEVEGTYDLINDIDYSIKRITDKIPIPHTDGAGMVLHGISKNIMVRLPWVKGLLGSFDFVKFIEEHNCSPIIKDIYGKEHNIIDEGIEVIFTKSQFKGWKYYDSWDDYKEKFKKYKCTAGIANIEDDRIRNSTINYQMLQTLTDITDGEIQKMVKPSADTLLDLTSSVENIQKAFGVTDDNLNMSYTQKIIKIYPDILNDVYFKDRLRLIKNSLIKRFKAGKLKVWGKYTFILPDFYAACEYWFLGIENPVGLLQDGEVYCNLFPNTEKLDCLRSPHLYREHAIRKNVVCDESKKEKIEKWFQTKGLYTSTHDLISKILMFDVDGDKALVVADKTIIKVAERNMNGIVPLYYNMRRAESKVLNNESIYDGLITAFTGGNIGVYSNDISKIWNSEVFISGSESEKQEALDLIKMLCMENNFTIDFAKTLYKPTRPKHIDKRLKSYSSSSLPHFFRYAKDKENEQVVDSNKSFMNKIAEYIPNPRLSFKKIGLNKVNTRLLIKVKQPRYESCLKPNGEIYDVDKTDPVIVKYFELSKEYIGIETFDFLDGLSPELKANSKLKEMLLFDKVSRCVKKELEKAHLESHSKNSVYDILCHFLFTRHYLKKTLFFLCYSKEMLEILEENFGLIDKKPHRTKIKERFCASCGKELNINEEGFRSSRCPECYKIYRREYKRIYKKNKGRQ